MNKKIVLKIDGRKMEFSNDLLGYQHLMDYVSREVRERMPVFYMGKHDTFFPMEAIKLACIIPITGLP